jgi:hypothetical protein
MGYRLIMFILNKLFHYAKYNLIDKWGFIYLEHDLDDSSFNMPEMDGSLVVRIAQVDDIEKIKNEMYPYMKEDHEYDKKFVDRIGDDDFRCFIALNDNVIVQYFMVYPRATESPLVKTPFNNKYIHDDCSYLGSTFTVPKARGMWVVPISLAVIIKFLRDEQKQKKVYVLVHKNTLGAKEFYVRLNFAVVENAASLRPKTPKNLINKIAKSSPMGFFQRLFENN